jgi:hypothetical protein
MDTHVPLAFICVHLCSSVVYAFQRKQVSLKLNHGWTPMDTDVPLAFICVHLCSSVVQHSTEAGGPETQPRMDTDGHGCSPRIHLCSSVVLHSNRKHREVSFPIHHKALATGLRHELFLPGSRSIDMRTLIAGLLLAPLSLFSQGIHFEFTDGTIAAYEIAQVRSMDFTGNDLRMFLWDGTTHEWDMNDIRKYRFDDIGTDVRDMEAMALAPLHLFPNPSTGEVTIEFQVDTPGAVKVELYDVRGTLAARIAEAQFAAGTHRLNWNGIDMNGEAPGTGTYVCRITQGAHILSKQMIIER